MDYYVKINYKIKTQLVNIEQFYTIPLPDWVYSRLTENRVFKFFKFLKNHLLLVIRYEHRSRLTARHFKFVNFKNRLKKLEKLKMNLKRISELKPETFEGVYKPVNICTDIPLTDHKQPSTNSYKLTTNNSQQHINTCENYAQK